MTLPKQIHYTMFTLIQCQNCNEYINDKSVMENIEREVEKAGADVWFDKSVLSRLFRNQYIAKFDPKLSPSLSFVSKLAVKDPLLEILVSLEFISTPCNFIGEFAIINKLRDYRKSLKFS